MRLAILSDIHANLHALDAVWDDLERQRPDAVYGLGDLVGYGAFPNEVVEFVAARSIPTVMGNYDDGVGFDLDDCGCVYRDPDDVLRGKQSLLWTREHTTGANKAFRVNGTPADCVALGLYRLDGADLVLSGINLGSNLGHEIWYSGTVAAARQAALLGVPAAAFSLVGGEGDRPRFRAVVAYVERVIRLLLEEPTLPLVNVNLPPEPKGIRWTRQSVRAHTGRVVEGEDTFGRRNYWLAEAPLSDPDEGTDRWAAERGLVSLTPLRLDLTDVTAPADPDAAALIALKEAAPRAR